jgi:hypothetical protein
MKIVISAYAKTGPAVHRSENIEIPLQQASPRKLQEAIAKVVHEARIKQIWQRAHAKIGCVHPPGATFCNWCGFSAKAATDAG